MERRAFFKLPAAASVGGLLLLSGCAGGVRRTAAGDAADGADPVRWATIEAVQAHLLPSEAGSPGAGDIRAADYLGSVLGDPRRRAEERDRLLRGTDRVNELARETAGAPFTALDAGVRDAVLRRLEGTREGGRWLDDILGYLLEALLADPVYGGNPGGVGWAWLGHDPGFPRPSADKRYFLL